MNSSQNEADKITMKQSTKSGIASMPTSTLFRITNFELYAKPNKVIMGAGLVAIVGCVSYIAFMNIRNENKQIVPETVSADSRTHSLQTKSKWD